MNHSVCVIDRDRLSPHEKREVFRLLLTAFSAKFESLQLTLQEKLAILMDLERHYLPQIPPVDYIVKEENKLIGLLTVSRKSAHSGKLEYLFELSVKYGLLTTLHSILLVTAFDYHPREKEQYIENIAVHEDYQRQGIAKKLIKMAQDNTKKGETLSLLVSAKNTQAMYLYLKCGFSIVKRKGNVLLGFLANEPNWFFMEWRR